MVRVMQWAYDRGKLIVTADSVKNAEGDQQELLDLDSSYCRITWSGAVFGMKNLKGSGYPCVEVTWYGAVAYCNYRSEMEGKTSCYNLADWSCNFDASGYRLPSSTEWEYAARGGVSGKRFPWGGTINHSSANYMANGSASSYDTSPYTSSTFHPDYEDDGYPYTSPAGDFAANGYGLYDMAGNVYEWCNDASGSGRHIRGGSWYNNATYLRCGDANWNYPDNSSAFLGFRATCR
jgi:formylglycine-generating enzyme required for sulfatase activity